MKKYEQIINKDDQMANTLKRYNEHFSSKVSQQSMISFLAGVAGFGLARALVTPHASHQLVSGALIYMGTNRALDYFEDFRFQNESYRQKAMDQRFKLTEKEYEWLKG